MSVALSTKAERELVQLTSDGLRKIDGHLTDLADKVKALEARDLPSAEDIAKALESDKIETAIQAQVDGVKSAVNDRLDQIEAQIAATRPDPGKTDAPPSWAAAIHAREEWKGISRRADGKWNATQFEMANVPSLVARAKGAKTVSVLGSAELGGLLDPFHRMTPVERLIEFSDMLSWIPRVPIGGRETFDFPRETEASRLGYLKTVLTAAIAAPDTSITVESTDGIEEGTFLRVIDDGTGSVLGSVEVASVTPPSTVGIVGTAGFVAAIDDLVTSEHYGATGEQADKPGGWMEYDKITLTLKTIAIMLGLTQQRIDSLPQFEGFVERKLRMRARRNLGWHIVYGDNTDAGQLAGFASDPDALSYLWSSGVTGDFRADAIMRAAALIHSGNPLTVHLNIREWQKVQLEKSTSDGHYVLTSFGPLMMVDRPGMRSLGPHMVNVDGVIRDADFLVVDHALASEWPDKEASAFAVGFINDDFQKNIVRVRYEDTLNHAILEPLAVVNGEFDAAP